MNDRLNRQTHFAMIEQAEREERAREDLRRVLYAPLRTAADLRPACSRCESGLSRCVTPDACERAEAEPKPSRAGDLVVVWALLLGAWAATAFVLLALGVRP